MLKQEHKQIPREMPEEVSKEKCKQDSKQMLKQNITIFPIKIVRKPSRSNVKVIQDEDVFKCLDNNVKMKPNQAHKNEDINHFCQGLTFKRNRFLYTYFEIQFVNNFLDIITKIFFIEL